MWSELGSVRKQLDNPSVAPPPTLVKKESDPQLELYCTICKERIKWAMYTVTLQYIEYHEQVSTCTCTCMYRQAVYIHACTCTCIDTWMLNDICPKLSTALNFLSQQASLFHFLSSTIDSYSFISLIFAASPCSSKRTSPDTSTPPKSGKQSSPEGSPKNRRSSWLSFGRKQRYNRK